MKKISAVFLFIMCYTCGSDSDSDTTQQYMNFTRVTTAYLSGEPYLKSRRTYVNNKPIADTIHYIEDNVWAYTKFFYENEKLSRIEIDSPSVINEYDFTYDELGRIIQTTNIVSENTSSTTYTYGNQIITSENITNGEQTTKEFLLNNDGIIYKEIGPEETVEIIYDEDYNVQSLISSIEPTNFYTYDSTNLPPVNAQIYSRFIYGDYKNNYALYDNSIKGIHFNYVATVPKYHLSLTNSEYSLTYEWTLNNDGYPLNMNVYNSNNQLQSSVDYFYD
ncbi:hypothetical protein [Psychroserpens mesophilus]|uniref:hypothetical protein n=1 Tax=Psychroserpens mesophilus TaxID=325473 RepID=UPI003D64593F